MTAHVRRVPPDWQHPLERGYFTPLLVPSAPIAVMQSEWDAEHRLWLDGLHEDQQRSPNLIRDSVSFEEWSGTRPEESEYMPAWSSEQATHFQLYESTLDIPRSPVMESLEELAAWLSGHGSGMYEGPSRSYDHWLRFCLAYQCQRPRLVVATR